MTETTNQKKSFLWPAVFGALGVVGIACWVMQIMGVGSLNLNNHVVWGLYIVGFTLCTGIAAGCLLFAASTVLFSALSVYEPHTRLAAFAAVVLGAVGAGLFIMADLGSPGRSWEMIAFAHPGSPLFWDTIILLAYVIVGVVFTMQLVKAAQGSTAKRSLKPIALIAFTAGVCVAITSFVFVFQVARPLWNNPGQTLSFVLSALIASGAVLVALFALANRSGYLTMDDKLSSDIAKILAFFVLAEFVFVLAEIANGIFSGVGESARTTLWLTIGAGAPFFWAEMVSFVATFVLLLQKKRALQMTGAILGLVTVFLVKYNMLQAELFNPLIGFAGFRENSGIVSGFYFPSLLEWGVAAGIVGIGALLLTLGMRKLKLGA